MPRKTEHKCYFGCTLDGPVHRFPKWTYPNEEKFQSWKSVLQPTTQRLGNEYIYNNIRFCYRHFEKFYHLPSRRLTKNAIPTLKVTSMLGDNDVASTSTLAYPTPAVINRQSQDQYVMCQPRETVRQVTDNKCRRTIKPELLCQGYSRKLKTLRGTLLNLRKKYESKKKLVTIASKVSNSKSFLKEIEMLPEPIKVFSNLQRKYFKKPRGRQYSLQEKILSLIILKRSPKAYNLLKNMFVLPSKRTLQKLLSSLVINPGINPNIFDNLKESVEKLPLDKRLCTLIFDEVALAPGLYYNPTMNVINGFEDYGFKRTPNIADHALVLMIKSMKGRFKQPIAFTFCQSATKKDDLKIILKDSIKALKASGINILCTVCDQASTNISTMKALLEDTKREYMKKGLEYKSCAFEIEGDKIFSIFDPPHLLKGIRNNFLTKNVRFIDQGQVKIAKWDHILQFIAKDVEVDELRLVNKINENHYIKEKIPKMKVKYAAQIFSQRLSAAIKFCIIHKILPEECGHTADFLFIFDRLFDSFNGSSYNGDAKVYKTCLKNNSPHFKLWNDLLPILRSMGFEVKKPDGTSTYQKVPSLNNFIQNIRVYKEMWMHLNQDHNITSLLTRNINQDPLENFFSKIRSNGIRNNNPTCDQFLNAYKTLVINNFATPHSVNAYCEDDNNLLFQSLEKLLTLNNYDKENNQCRQFDLELVLDELETTTQPSIENDNMIINNETKKYVTGWVVKKARSSIFKNCPVCVNALISKKPDASSYTYTRDYTKKSLLYTTTACNDLMKKIIEIISKCLREYPQSRQLAEIIAFNIDFSCDFTTITKCDEHNPYLKKYIVMLTTKLIIHSWCTSVNKLLKGKITQFNKDDKIKVEAFKMHKKNIRIKK